MNIEQFEREFGHLKQQDKVVIMCDDPRHDHSKPTKPIGAQAAKRNILKRGGKEYICAKCVQTFDNAMNKIGKGRNSLGKINVLCPTCEKEREMDSACYYGSLEQPYSQICGTCTQVGKEIPQETRDKISEKLTGRELSEEHKKNISNYMLTNDEGIERGKKNLIPGFGSGWNLGQQSSEETRKKQSEAMLGRIYSDEHCDNISEGRKKMLEETGGFTKEHRENLSRKQAENISRGFVPHLHHISGWFISPKAGKIFHRSSDEHKAFTILDNDPNVKIYYCEKTLVKYYNPDKEINSTTIVDIHGTMIDGSKFIIEVKPVRWLKERVNVAKFDAIEQWAQENDHTFTIWDDSFLFPGGDKERKEYALWLRGEIGSEEQIKMSKEASRISTKKHYDKKIKTNRVDVFCECGQCDGKILSNIARKAYDDNIGKNGYYLSKECSDKRPKIRPIDENVYPEEGKKKCSGLCGLVLPLEDFSISDKTTQKRCGQCKKCRAAKATKNNQDKKKTEE